MRPTLAFEHDENTPILGEKITKNEALGMKINRLADEIDSKTWYAPTGISRGAVFSEGGGGLDFYFPENEGCTNEVGLAMKSLQTTPGSNGTSYGSKTPTKYSKTLNLTSPFFDTLDMVLAAAQSVFSSPCMIAGGAVRDTLLGREVKDIDVFIEYPGHLHMTEIEKFQAIVGATSSELSKCNYGQMVHLGDIEGSTIIGKPVQLVFVKGLDTYLDSFNINLSKASYSLSTGLTMTREFLEDWSHNQITVNQDEDKFLAEEENGQVAYVQRIQAKYPDFKVVKASDVDTSRPSALLSKLKNDSGYKEPVVEETGASLILARLRCAKA